MNRVKRLFDILLLLVNSVGIIGAVLEVAGIRWSVMPWDYDTKDAALGYYGYSAWKDAQGNIDVMLNGGIFWVGLFFCCVAAILIYQGHDKRKILVRWGVCALIYLFLAAVFWRQLSYGLYLAWKGAIEQLNSLYQFHIALPDGVKLAAEVGKWGEYQPLLMTLSVLFCVFPLELLAGYGWKHDRMFSLLIGNVLWFTGACVFDRFPGFLLLTFCVLGVVVALVYKDFEEEPKAGLQAVGVMVALAGVVLGISYFVLLPGLDDTFLAIMKEREIFYKLVNDQWIPGLQSAFSGIGTGGIGAGVDVTGNLHRTNLFSYTSADTYRVSVDRLPEGTLYLKGFVGGTYGESAWEAIIDQQLELYYRKNGLILPENYAELVNISYEAVSGQRQAESEVNHIKIEELGGRGSYSIYPYGALLTDEFRVHSDGSVERRGKEYGFQYYFFQGNGGIFPLTGEWQRLERQYRQYVYENFLDYPEERLPLLTAALAEEKIRTDTTMICALDLMRFLEKRAVYDLDAGRNPSGTDFVDYFLFESHEGYCVHFASAGVLAFRYFGIPARYATGYVVSPGDFTKEPDGYTAVLTGKQAHAWVEIYLDEVGWVPVEMTPGAVAFGEDNRMEVLGGLDSWQEDGLGLWEGQGEMIFTEWPWEELIASAEPEEELLPAKPLDGPEEEGNGMDAAEGLEGDDEGIEDDSNNGGKGTGDGSNGAKATGDGGKGAGDGLILGRTWQELRPMAVIFAVLLTISALAVLWFRRQSEGKRRWYEALGKAGSNECVFLLYRNLRKALRIAGCPERAVMRGAEFWRKSREICPELNEEEYEAFCRMMEKATFGKTELSQEELRQVREFHDKLVERIYRETAFYKRVLFQMWKCYVSW